LLFLAACDDDLKEIGMEIQPDIGLSVHQTDTFSFHTYSRTLDSIRSDETSRSILGSYYDPVFGITTASVYTAFSLSNTYHDFGTGAVADSIHLIMAYNGYYGDTTTTQNLHVYQLQEQLQLDSAYYSHQTFDYDEGTDYASNFLFEPRPYDSVYIDSIAYTPRLTIPLGVDLANLLIGADETVMESDDNFMAFFNGLVIIPDKIETPQQGALCYFNMNSTYTTLRLFYHNDFDTTYFDYPSSTLTPRTNHFEHYGYEDASQAFRNQVLEGDTTLGDMEAYSQPMAGIELLVRFPDISQPDSGMAVNNATLHLKINQDFEMYEAPSTLNLFMVNENREYYALPDNEQGSGYFGGVYNETNGEYVFRISRFLQETINKTAESNLLSITVNAGATNANRLILKGPDALNGSYIEVLYTNVE
jgi:hypothetical protein